ncbi:MAG: tRNA pseudouridine(55) synthase TruB [Alphaproteobacteria bacterium]|nr:tRNA pseudouridine(55) synthase TruB [Alphaproteobacteria bacterium]
MPRHKENSDIHGWVNLDKPLGMTSMQAVGKIRSILKGKKVGHAGTLDPLATGILPIALGEATKTIPYIQDSLKTYEFTVTWGEQRDTDDMEGDIIATSDQRPDKKSILEILPEFTGNIEQTPPRFSAIKIDGKRAYDLARSGQKVDLKPRNVYIKSLKLIEENKDTAQFEMICGKGTYVRSLARDMAEKLGTKGYVSALRRTKVGPFTLENTISLDKLLDIDYFAARCEALLPVGIALDDIPALILNREETEKLRKGQTIDFISRPDFERLEKAGLSGAREKVAVASYMDQTVAIIEVNKYKIKPVRVFNF